MPITDRKPFKRNPPPKDLKPDEELFYLKATHEVFRSYDDFFARVISCNSLVWTCALTGKSNLTFQEALTSEEEARQSLRTFPMALRKPILYLASLTDKKRFNDMCEDVFMYVKDRFFVGEEVEVTVNGIRKSSEVTQVILPEQKTKSPAKAEIKPKKAKEISPSKIKYEVVNYSTGKTTIVKPDCMSRPKGAFTKPRNKLFLKTHTEPKAGVFKVKDNIAQKEQLEEFQFEEVFSGPLPSYAQPKKSPEKVQGNKKLALDSSGKKTVQGKLNFKKESNEERKKNLEKQALDEKERMASEKERLKKEMLKKQQMEDAKEMLRQKKIDEREKKKEEKKKMAEYLISWKKPRDDLECDDLKDLPQPIPIDCALPPECFGDAIMVMEFLKTFEKQVQVKGFFPHGVTFEHMEKALTETDIQGTLNDLLQLFLTALFRYREADEDSVDIKGKKMWDLGDLNIDKATDLAQIVSTWPQQYHGTILRNIPLDSFSVSEVLRLHILTSGAKQKISWQGVASPSEDPGLIFKIEEPELLKKLATYSVFELTPAERCKIIHLLINQLLFNDVLRYAVDENADNSRPLRNELKQVKWAISRLDRGDLTKKKNPTKEPKAEGDSESPITIPDDANAAEDEEKENANLTPAEKAELREKKAKEIARQKADLQKKEKDIETQIRKMQSSFNIIPLGRDRAYRRYWVFETIAGIFIEDDDAFKGKCLPKPTVQSGNPQMAHARSETAAISIKKYLQSIDSKSGSSDKENEILRDIAIVQSDLAFPLKNRKLSDLNPRVDSKKGSPGDGEVCQLCNTKTEKQDSSVLFCPHMKSELPEDQCTADIETCPIHNLNAPRTQWSFYYKEDDINNLLSSLNDRGFRERSLKETLMIEKERIVEIMNKSSFHTFNKTLPPPLQPEVRKSQRLTPGGPTVSSFAEMSPRHAQELTLRDMILELEHRIFHGGLGSIKVEDREKWRTDLENGAFELQVNGIAKTEADNETNKEESKETKPLSNVPIEQVVKELAQAMLIVSNGIESKYLNSPLGESEESKKAKQKLPEPEKKKSLGKSTSLERWQESLMQCTSPSQLFVHLGTLERSVAWSRSVLKAHCRICRRRGDGENMLLCDGCNRGHHLYCLKPPLTAIPEGDWFCLSCKPAEKPASPEKKVRKVESESEAESENESEEGDEDEEEDVEVDGNSSEAEESAAQEWCEICGDVGTLLCCDRCPLMYHQECVELRRIPRGEWVCPKCTKKEEAVKKAQKHPSNGSHSTRASSLTAESKKKNATIKAKFASKGVKRKYEDSFESDYRPSKKRNERRSNGESEKEENPFKKVYKDSVLSGSRRRTKTGGDDDMLDYIACVDMLAELMRHPSSWPFLIPVSKKDAPDYHQIIKRPMDFGTIRSKLNNTQYKTNEDFIRDIYLVLLNCQWFNPKSSDEYKESQVLYKEVKKLLQNYQLCNPLAIEKLVQSVSSESS